MSINYSITNVVECLSTYKNKVLCEKCFQSDPSHPIRERLPDPIDFVLGFNLSGAMRSGISDMQPCICHFERSQESCNHGSTYPEMISCEACYNHYIKIPLLERVFSQTGFDVAHEA